MIKKKLFASRVSEPISAMLESGRSLADISLDDAAGLDQLDEFLGPVTDETFSEDPGDDLLRNDNGARNCETGQKKKGQATTRESEKPSFVLVFMCLFNCEVSWLFVPNHVITRDLLFLYIYLKLDIAPEVR